MTWTLPADDPETEQEAPFKQFDGQVFSALLTEDLFDPEVYAAAILPYLKPELFSTAETKYLAAELLNYHEEHGTIPTRALFRAHIGRKLTVDEPFEAIIEIIDKKVSPRDITYLKTIVKDWARRAILRQIHSAEGLQATKQGDPTFIQTKLAELAALEQTGKGGFLGTILTPKQLRALKNTEEFIVDGILAAGQNMIIGGVWKGGKTSLALDLAISIASGGKFLGCYQAKQKRVLFISGETNAIDLQKKVDAIERARHITDDDIEDHFRLATLLPELNTAQQLALLKAEIEQLQPAVVFIDPLAKTLNPSGQRKSAGNLFDMYSLLGALCDTCLQAGAIPILLHHTSKGADATGWPELRHLTQSGPAEFARQWILVNSDFDAGAFDMKLTIGAGASGRSMKLRVHLQDWDPIAEQHCWVVQVQDQREIHQAEKAAQEAKAAEEGPQLIAAVRELNKKGPVSQTALREKLNWSTDKVRTTLEREVRIGRLEKYRDRCGKTRTDCYRPSPTNTPQHSAGECYSAATRGGAENRGATHEQQE